MEIVQRIISTPFVSFFDSNLHMLSRPGETTINAQYVIEPNQNGGVNYQYDVVVKNRNERRRLDAGDCECYREGKHRSLVYFILLLYWRQIYSITMGSGLFLVGYNLHFGARHQPSQTCHIYVILSLQKFIILLDL